MPRHLPFLDSPLFPPRRLPFVSTVGCANSTGFPGAATRGTSLLLRRRHPRLCEQRGLPPKGHLLLSYSGHAGNARYLHLPPMSKVAIFTEFMVTRTQAWVGCQNTVMA